jgi:hypothetical protein
MAETVVETFCFIGGKMKNAARGCFIKVMMSGK